MASIKKTKNLIKINTSHQKLNSFNKNSSNQSENTNSKEDNNSNFVEKSFLADLLKCEICKNVFDLNLHIPMVAKCGHTFCKKCILEKNYESKNPNQYEECPLDNMQNIFNIESCIINLRIELLIKKIFSFYPLNSQPPQQNAAQKQIVYSKPDIKKTRAISNNHLNSHSPMNEINEEYGYKKLDMNNNNETNKKSFPKNNEINDVLISPKIEDEINLNNDNKFLFEDEKINGVIINETIETIPIFDEKSFGNVSFKEDINELFAKNNISNKKPLLNENTKKETNKNITSSNNTKKKNKKIKVEFNINKNSKNPQIPKSITTFSLTPNKNKDNKQILAYLDIKKNNHNTDREFYNENLNNGYKLNINCMDSIEKENADMTKYKNNTHRIREVYDKIPLKLNGTGYNFDFKDEKIINENIMKNKDDLLDNNNNIKNTKKRNVIVINKAKKKENQKNVKDLYINTLYCPSKKKSYFFKFNNQ